MSTICYPWSTHTLKSEQYTQTEVDALFLKLLCNFMSEMRFLHLIHAAMITISMQVHLNE